METLLQMAKNQEIKVSFKYYGKEDLATGWEIKYLVDNAKLFESAFSDYTLHGIGPNPCPHANDRNTKALTEAYLFRHRGIWRLRHKSQEP